jgi:phosphotriesterase-related protein
MVPTSSTLLIVTARRTCGSNSFANVISRSVKMPCCSFRLTLTADRCAIAKREGIACIVDAGHHDMGRDVGALRQLSLRSGMPIVVGGGFYAQPFYPREISTMSEDQIVQALIGQAEAHPIGAFGEIGWWDHITKDERRVFRAVGRAHPRNERFDLHAHRHSGEVGA